MKKVLLAIMLICLLIPSIGWGKEWILWFQPPNCACPCCCGLKSGIFCKIKLQIAKHSQEEGDLEFKLIVRENWAPHKKIFETDWIIQKEVKNIYELEDIIPSSYFYSKLLEIKIKGKQFPSIYLLLKNPFDEDFEVIDENGNQLTCEDPNGQIIIPHPHLVILPIVRKGTP